MDVAFVSNVVYPFVHGGAQKRIHEIGTRLADRGHAVTVYGRHHWDGPRRMDHDGMVLRAVAPERELYTGGRRSIVEAVEFAGRLLGPLRRRVRDHDVVVASVFPYFPVLAATASAVGTSVPLVTTWHEVWRDYWYDYLGWTGGAGAAVERLVATVPQRPVAVSPTTADQLAGLGVAREEIAVVPNGVDVERIRTVDPVDDGYDVLFVGRLVPDKNVDLLVRAFDRLDRDVTLGIVGDGPARATVARAIEAADREDAVDLLGHLASHEAVLAQMRAADVYASPSTREGFGTSVLEAMAAGCRVVAAEHPRSAVTDVLGDDDLPVAATDGAFAAGLARALDQRAAPGAIGDGGESGALVDGGGSGALEDGREPGALDDRIAGYDWDRVTDRAEAEYRRAVETQ